MRIESFAVGRRAFSRCEEKVNGMVKCRLLWYTLKRSKNTAQLQMRGIGERFCWKNLNGGDWYGY